MRATIRKVGNSQGILIPKPVLARLGFEREVEIKIEGDALVVRQPAKRTRDGWAEASKAIADAGDDALLMGAFGNSGDSRSAW